MGKGQRCIDEGTEGGRGCGRVGMIYNEGGKEREKEQQSERIKGEIYIERG
jgi:hypothetical protein